MTFIVVTSVEMPLETTGMTAYEASDGELISSVPMHHARFVHYGPFDNEDEAREYAQIVDGGAHELIAPVAA